METSPVPPTFAPPKLIPAFLAGFNAVASHVEIILLPILFDLVLLFGPRLSLEQALMPIFSQAMDEMQSIVTPATTTALNQAQTIWLQILQSFNLLSTLRTYPIGLPSLLSSQGVTASPLGPGTAFAVTSLNLAVALWFLFLLIGILLGSLFFNRLAQITGPKKEKVPVSNLLWRAQQILFLTIIAFAILIIIGIPVLGTLALVASGGGGISQFILIGGTVLLIWIAMPLVFSTHGIFVEGKPMMQSVLTSIRLVRYFMPWTSLFLMIALLMSQGLNTLWLSAEPTSWLILIGIGGHAFISTALLAASFVYYQDGLAYMQATLKRIAERTSTQA